MYNFKSEGPDIPAGTIHAKHNGREINLEVCLRPVACYENRDCCLLVLKHKDGREKYLTVKTTPIPEPSKPFRTVARLGLEDNSLILCEEESTDLNLKPFEDKLRALRHSIPEKTWKLEVITQYSNGLTDKRRIGE